MSIRYGQICPVSKAAELPGERWTLLIIRELVLGTTRFNDFQRALSQISPTLPTKRLNQLQEAGVSGEPNIIPRLRAMNSNQSFLISANGG
jgi:DNA-binding HxlR family transcriptional regulator